MQSLRDYARLTLIAASAGMVLAVMLTVGGVFADSPAGGTLKDASQFDAITDKAARSSALFEEAAKVITDPRCINCHPATRSPTQGDDKHPHMPPMMAGESGKGVAGLDCHACHRFSNTTLVGSRLGSVPGAEHWLLAPASMGWQGLTLGEICRQLKDPARNGGRTLADIHKHVSTDHLVGWAWHPGEGRRPAPGTQDIFGDLIGAWIATGAECPA